MMPSEVQPVLSLSANGTTTSTRLGCRYLSPTRLSPCTTSAPIVASESASCSGRRSAPRPRVKRPLISRPTQTPRLERKRAAVPAAREVIQNRCGPVALARRLVICRASAARLGRFLEEAERFLGRAGGLDDLARAVVVNDHAAVRKPASRIRGAPQDRGLGAYLCERGARRERCHLHDAREGGTAGRGIEQVVARPPVCVGPAASPDAAGGCRSVALDEGVEELGAEWAGDLDRALDPAAAADAQVAGAVDRERRMAIETLREQVAEEALGEAAAVEPETGWAGDDVLAQVDAEERPARSGVRRRRGAWRRLCQCVAQVYVLRQVGRVASGLDLPEQGRVDQAVSELR